MADEVRRTELVMGELRRMAAVLRLRERARGAERAMERKDIILMIVVCMFKGEKGGEIVRD